MIEEILDEGAPGCDGHGEDDKAVRPPVTIPTLAWRGQISSVQPRARWEEISLGLWRTGGRFLVPGAGSPSQRCRRGTSAATPVGGSVRRVHD